MPAALAFAALSAGLGLGSCCVLQPAFAAELVQAEPAERAFDLHIEGGKLARGDHVIRVKQGDAVRLRCTATAPVDLHLHGYEIELRVEPGAVAEMAFKAHATGRFPIQIHGARASGGGHRHGPPLVQIEVHPR